MSIHSAWWACVPETLLVSQSVFARLMTFWSARSAISDSVTRGSCPGGVASWFPMPPASLPALVDTAPVSHLLSAPPPASRNAHPDDATPATLVPGPASAASKYPHAALVASLATPIKLLRVTTTPCTRPNDNSVIIRSVGIASRCALELVAAAVDSMLDWNGWRKAGRAAAAATAPISPP